jgi:type VI secretion system protein ImpM
VPDRAVIGFFGKIPSKGDFVQAGLPRSFVDAWDAWMQDRLYASREALGEAWQPLWLEAPIWRFRLGPGQCGPTQVAGLWLPSVDRVGRHFPLVIAALNAGTQWLDDAEALGLAVLEQDLTPEAISATLPRAPIHDGPAEHGTIWWTQGAPSVAASTRRFGGLPSREEFVAMLQDQEAEPAPAPQIFP